MSITNNVKTRLKIARKTEAEWESSNPVGLDGEWMVTKDASPIKLKIGDGTTAWSDLEYAEFGGDGGGDYLPLSGGTMTGDIIMDNHAIGGGSEITGTILIGKTVRVFEASGEAYADWYFSLDDMKSVFKTNANEYEFNNSSNIPVPVTVGTPTKDSHASTKKYVDNAITTAINNITVADDIGY